MPQPLLHATMRIATRAFTPLPLVFLLFLASPLSAAYVEAPEENSFASTHQFLMDAIPGILEHDGYPELAELLRGGWLSHLKQGSIDADATILHSREHYMSPWDHTGLLEFMSAGEKAKIEFTLAEQAWRHGQREKAFLHLGWAMHMIQDLTVPHHATLNPKETGGDGSITISRS